MTYAVEKAVSGRRPITIFEMDLDYCQETYGTLPCAGAIGVTGTNYCYNTRATCQDAANFNPNLPGSPTTRTSKTYRFCDKRSDLPANLSAIPCVTDVSTAPTKLEIEGGLGQRASVSITCQDFSYHDRGIDKYAGIRFGGSSLRANVGGDALQANAGGDDLQATAITLAVEASGANLPGTYWGRLRARNPYYIGRTVRVLTGYLTSAGYDSANFVTRTYLLEQISGPDADGKVTIKAKDPLKLADNTRATAPRPSTGRLSADITNAATSATLLPAGIGATEYPASGLGRIGSEIVSFTRAADVLTLTRGQHRTTAEAHTADDVFQLCLQFSAATFPDIVQSLLVDYAEVPLTYIPTADWDYQEANFTYTLSALIAEPTGVAGLIRELCESAGGLIWWDEESAVIRIRKLQQPSSDAVVDEDSNIVEGSLTVRDVPELRCSQAWVYSNLRDPTASMREARNWLQLQVTSDLEEEGANLFGQPAIKTVYSRWITSRAASTSLADLYTERFGDTPREFTWAMDAKDASYKTGDVVRLSTRLVQDETGANDALAVQITQVREDEAGHRFNYTGTAFDATPYTPEGIIINITANENNLDLLDRFTTLRGAPDATTVVTFVIESAVTIGSTQGVFVGDYSLRTGVWPTGATVSIENNGIIQGNGGRGGGLLEAGQPDIISGQVGGNALLAEYAVSFSNFGSLWGGGGGGAPIVSGSTVVGGGGGAGTNNGVGGYSTAPTADGGTGTASAGGAGATHSTLGQAGDGGGPGENGEATSSSYGRGLAGYYVTNDSLVTWVVTGDRRGRTR